MSIEMKITLKGKMERHGANMRLMIDADAKKLCFYWNICCGRPINQFAKS